MAGDHQQPFIYIVIRVPSLANVVVWSAIGGIVSAIIKLM